MTFAWPWAFFGLLALPALAAIYWLRQRARRRPVSSLLLWRDAPVARASGRRFERFEGGRTFLLELLVLALLVLAAAGPRLPAREARRPLVAVLDDSLSMRAVSAAGAPTARQAAADALLRELENGRHGAVTLVAAGERPRVLGDAGTVDDATGDVAERLTRWRAMSHAADLASAVALASDLGGGRARLLVLSDRPPEEPPASGRLVWWAFGRAAPNLAVVGAMRGSGGNDAATDGCLVEVANYSPRPAVARLTAAMGEEAPEPVSRLEIGAGEVTRVRFAVPSGREARLRLTGDDGDALALDDEAILLPKRGRSVRVSLEIADAGLRRLIEGALDASERAVMTADRVELVITDAAAGGRTAGGVPAGGVPATWRLRLVTREPATPYLGPFVLDRGHALTAGLSLDGVIWAAAAAAGGESAGEPAGEPVITAGDAALLTERESAGGRRVLTLFWRPELSSLQRTPNWPILWWNLLEWRARSLPGARAANLRLGAEAVVGLASADGDAELELPDGTRRRLNGPGGRLTIRAEHLGIHRLRHGGRSDRWAVNALAAEESDLRHVASGRWGDWSDDAAQRWRRRGVGWIPLLLSAAGLVLHLVWTGRR